MARPSTAAATSSQLAPRDKLPCAIELGLLKGFHWSRARDQGGNRTTRIARLGSTCPRDCHAARAPLNLGPCCSTPRGGLSYCSPPSPLRRLSSSRRSR